MELSLIQRLGISWRAAPGVDDGGCGVGAHAAGADGVGGAVEGPDVGGPGGLPDGAHLLVGVGDHALFVFAVGEVDARLGQAAAVEFVGEFEEVVVA